MIVNSVLHEIYLLFFLVDLGLCSESLWSLSRLTTFIWLWDRERTTFARSSKWSGRWGQYLFAESIRTGRIWAFSYNLAKEEACRREITPRQKATCILERTYFVGDRVMKTGEKVSVHGSFPWFATHKTLLSHSSILERFPLWWKVQKVNFLN